MKKNTKKPTKKTAKRPAKVAKAKMPAKVAKPAAVALPAHFTTPGGCEFEISAKSIAVCEGLREIVFKPEAATILTADLAEVGGEKLAETIPAGTAILTRGDVVRLVPAEYGEIVAAIAAAKREAVAAKKAAAAEAFNKVL